MLGNTRCLTSNSAQFLHLFLQKKLLFFSTTLYFQVIVEKRWWKSGPNFLKMDSSNPKNGLFLSKNGPKWTLPVQNGLFYSQNGVFWSLNGPKMDSSGPKMDSSVSQMDSSSPKIVPLPFLSSLKVVFQMYLEIVFCWCYSSANSKKNCSKCNLIFSSYRGWKKASE